LHFNSDPALVDLLSYSKAKLLLNMSIETWVESLRRGQQGLDRLEKVIV